MDALVMAGGRGTRLDAESEKPLVEIGGRPMIDRVLDGFEESAVESVFVATSPATPETREHVEKPCIPTPGEGYVADLDVALDDDRLDRPVLTVTADLPLLEADVVDHVLAAHDGGSLTVVVPVALKAAIGVSVNRPLPDADRWTPSGLNVVDEGPDDRFHSWDARLAVDVDHPDDATLATRLVTHESINPDDHP